MTYIWPNMCHTCSQIIRSTHTFTLKHAHTHIHTTSLLPSHSINDVEKKYYADGENAYDMRKRLKPRKGAKGGDPSLPPAQAPLTPQREEEVRHDLEHGTTQ